MPIDLSENKNEIDQVWLLVHTANKIFRKETFENDFIVLNNVWRLLQIYETAKAFTIPHYTGDMHKIFADIDKVKEQYYPLLGPGHFIHFVNQALNSFILYRHHKDTFKDIPPLFEALEACWKRESAND